MGLGLPNFNFIFQSKGISAIERSARGIVAVILNDDTEGEEQNVYNKVDDVDFTQWTEDNYNCWTVSFQKQYLLCSERCFFGRSAG